MQLLQKRQDRSHIFYSCVLVMVPHFPILHFSVDLCDLEKSFCVDRTINVHLFMYKHILANIQGAPIKKNNPLGKIHYLS